MTRKLIFLNLQARPKWKFYSVQTSYFLIFFILRVINTYLGGKKCGKGPSVAYSFAQEILVQLFHNISKNMKLNALSNMYKQESWIFAFGNI